MRALALSLSSILLIAACATPAQRAAQVQRDVDEMIAVYGPGCERLGYKADSDPWRECVLKLAASDRLERRDITTTNCIGSRGFLQCNTF